MKHYSVLFFPISEVQFYLLNHVYDVYNHVQALSHTISFADSGPACTFCEANDNFQHLEDSIKLYFIVCSITCNSIYLGVFIFCCILFK